MIPIAMLFQCKKKIYIILDAKKSSLKDDDDLEHHPIQIVTSHLESISNP